MYSIGLNGKLVDLHDLPIADTFAHKLTREDLLLELLAMKVPGIEPYMGHQQLAVAYALWLRERQEGA